MCRHVSARYMPPQTDAELARQLKEWVSGALYLRVESSAPAPVKSHPFLPIRTTNSMNAGGHLVPSSLPSTHMLRIFTIPLGPGAASCSPGLVVFECNSSLLLRRTLPWIVLRYQARDHVYLCFSLHYSKRADLVRLFGSIVTHTYTKDWSLFQYGTRCLCTAVSGFGCFGY
jgi:hypothetical protein